jgi:hypothetical protein
VPELAALVAAAVRERTPELERLIRADVDREARRALLDELRQNGVEYVERDGQSFRVLRLLGTNAGLASRVDRRREASRLSLL